MWMTGRSLWTLALFISEEKGGRALFSLPTGFHQVSQFLSIFDVLESDDLELNLTQHLLLAWEGNVFLYATLSVTGPFA